MKFNLFVCALACFFSSYSQSDRDIIYKIDSLNATAQKYLNGNKMVESFKVFNLVNKYSDSIGDSYGKAIANYNLGKIFLKMQAYNDAERSLKVMHRQAEKINDNFLMAQAYTSLGQLKEEKNDINKAIEYLEKALIKILNCEGIKEEGYDKTECFNLTLNIRTKLCEYYLIANEEESAVLNLLKVENLLIRKRDPRSMYYKGYINYLYGVYFHNQGFNNNAIEKFNIAISYYESGVLSDDQFKTDEIYSKIYQELSKSLAELGRSKDAYKALLRHIAFNEKLLTQIRINNETITRSRLTIEDYKNQAETAKAKELYQKQKASNIKTINLIIVFTLILLVICLIILLRSYNSNRRLSIFLSKKNKELEIARKEAVKSSELKSKFISNVTHELRTPLYGVVGITSLLLEKNSLDVKDNKLLSSLKFSGDYLLNLVNEVLQFSKVESEVLELKLTTINIRELIKNNISSFSYRLQEANNKIEINIDEDVPKFIKCDNVRLSQVLLNLIGNSIKFTQSGLIIIRVKTLNLNNNKAHLRFEVEDDGIGIPKDKQETVFDNFSQVSGNINVGCKGTGLGLSISKKIVELFGSEIELESEEGVGSKFSFNATFEIDFEKEKVLETQYANGDNVDIKKKFNILIAEDNKINQVVTKNLLTRQNYQCEIVENGDEAIKALENNSFDLILMDINMPVMNGIEATKHIRDINPNIPIIALTAADIEYVKKNYNEIGFNGILTKPFDNIEFFQMIDSNIELSSAHELGALNKVS